MYQVQINELIERSNYIKTCFTKTGGNGMPIFNTLAGSEFEEWLADIKAVVIQLKTDSLTQSIVELTDSFNGWSDEKNLDKLVAGLKALHKNQEHYFSTKTKIMGDKAMNNKRVFVVHGRNEKIRKAIFKFLHSIGVEPIEWNEAKRLTRKASPYIGEVLDVAFTEAQAIIVLFTPDEEAKLRDEFINEDDSDYERDLSPQARPNVIFEAGMAIGRMEERTIIIQFGKLRPFSDIGGRHIIKFVDNAEKRHEIVDHLKIAGVEVNIDGKTDWLCSDDFKI